MSDPFENIVEKMQSLEHIKIIAKENNFNLVLFGVESQLLELLEDLSKEVSKKEKLVQKEKEKVDPKA